MIIMIVILIYIRYTLSTVKVKCIINLQLLSGVRMNTKQTMADLSDGEKGIIASITGDKSVKQRLTSMGLIKGTEVKVEYSSLFGDPRTYLVRGYSICMRKLEAQQVELI